MKSEHGPPMTAPPLHKSGLSFGARTVSIRSSPTSLSRSHLRCLPRWLLGTAPKRPCPIGASGSSAPNAATAKDLVEWKRREASARSALEILSAGKPGAYEAALGELDERTRTSWQEEFFPELENPDEDENANEDEDPNDECASTLKADATGLAEYLEGSVLPDCATQLGYVENRSVIRAQVLGEALDLGRLAPLGRYEIQLDRKLERMLAMLLRLHSLRRSNEFELIHCGEIAFQSRV